MVFATISCKKREVVDPYGDPKYFVKVRVIADYVGVGYNFYLLDGDAVMLRTYDLTNDSYLDKYKIRENYPVNLRVIDWEDKYLYWDTSLVLDEAKENFDIPLVMDSDKNLRVIMSDHVIEKYYLDIEVPANSGISVIVRDETSDARYIDVFTKDSRIYFLKGMNVTLSATNESGADVTYWRVNSSGQNSYPVGKEIKIRDISKNYTILSSPYPLVSPSLVK